MKNNAMVITGFMVCFLLSPILRAVSSDGAVEKRLTQLEESVERIDAELDVIKSQSKMVISQSQLGVLNRTYFKSGFAVLLPRSRTFSQKTDTGLGAFLGMGQYFGRRSALDLAFEWDIYPSITARYRFEVHLESPRFTFGPVLGYKVRIAEAGPWDHFIDSAESLKGSYSLFGFILGFPINQSMLTIEFDYLFNEQSFLNTHAGIHLFF